MSSAAAESDDLWSWLNANGGTITTIATVVTALVAIGALLAAARDSRDRSRPYLAAELFPAPQSTPSIAFRVFNYGPTMARDVRVRFDPEIPDVPRDDPAHHVRTRYAEPIPHLSPGQALGNTWQTFAIQGKISQAPDECQVTIRYRGSGQREYTDTFKLRIESVMNETESTSSDSEIGSLRRIARALEAIAKKK